MKGLFITFEGIDGCGKSTQIEMFKDRIAHSGRDFMFVREPGGTSIGENIRSILLDKVNTGMTPETELLLFEAARAQNVSDVILPALQDGKIVICDRFADSSTAYQGYGRKLNPDTVRMLNNYATRNIKPDLTFLFDIQPEGARERLSGRCRDSDRLDAENVEFMHRVRNGYLEMASQEPERFRIIDASRDINDIADEIFKLYGEVID